MPGAAADAGAAGRAQPDQAAQQDAPARGAQRRNSHRVAAEAARHAALARAQGQLGGLDRQQQQQQPDQAAVPGNVAEVAARVVDGRRGARRAGAGAAQQGTGAVLLLVQANNWVLGALTPLPLVFEWQ